MNHSCVTGNLLRAKLNAHILVRRAVRSAPLDRKPSPRPAQGTQRARSGRIELAADVAESARLLQHSCRSRR